MRRRLGLRPARPRPRPGRARAGGAVAGRGAAAGQRGLPLPGLVGVGRGEGPGAPHRQADEDSGQRLSRRSSWWVLVIFGFDLWSVLNVNSFGLCSLGGL